LTGLSDTVARLNGSFGGRPLFGGDSGEAPLAGADEILDAVRGLLAAAPDTTTGLAAVEDWFDDPVGGFTTAIYRGGDGDGPTVEVDKDSRITTSLRADDQAFRDVLRGLTVTALAAEADTSSTRTAMLTVGQATLSRGSEDVLGLQSRLGVNEERAASALAEHEAQAATLSIAYNTLTGRDQAEAATEMRLLESQLEAAYLTTARMSALSLVNFLR
jgi:flagellar hook-associated protein 3 FlgL